MIEDRDTHRLLKQAERDRRVAALYLQQPELKELDDALTAAGKEGLRRAWEGGNVQGAKQRLATLQKEREALLSRLGVGEDAFDVAWDCPHCQDRGYTNPGEICVCRLKENGSRRLMDCGLSPLQRQMTFENFALSWYDHPAEVGRLVAQIKNFCQVMADGGSCGNVFLYGPVGCGKTHLSSAAANQVLEAGKSVAYIRTEAFLENARDLAYGRTEGRDPQLMGRLASADLLILEDLGAESVTDFTEAQLINLIDQRINWQKPWMVTSSLTMDQLVKTYDQRLADRLLSEGKRLHLNEKSVRYKRTIAQEE